MDIYYKKIRKKSMPFIFIGIGMIGFSIYMIWKYTLGSDALAKDHTAIAGFFCISLLLGAFLMYESLRSVHTLKKDLEQLGIRESDIAEDLANGNDFTLCNVGKKYALNCSGRPEVILLESALIVYQKVHMTRSNGYNNYTYHVFVTDESGKEKDLEAKSEDEMRQIFDSILEIVPYAITQTDSVIQELRKKNLPELVRIVEKRKADYESSKADFETV